MTQNINPALGAPPYVPGSSPPGIFGGVEIRRGLVKIPSAQKELLGLHQSWASFLSRRPAGFINVPPQVLGQLKASYTRQKQATEPDKATRPTDEAEGGAQGDASTAELSQSQSLTSTRIERSGEDGDDEDQGHDQDPDEPISWPSSPETHMRPTRFESQEPVQPFITQIPEKSPPKSALLTSLPGRSKLATFPQSSQGGEDELEVEAPAALAHNPEPINKSALPMFATPPSAQVVPCTFEQSIQSTTTNAATGLDPQPKPKSRKPIYSRVPELYRGPKLGAWSSHLHTNADSNKVNAPLSQSPDTESSLSTNIMPSSIIPSTSENQSTQSEKHATGWSPRPGHMPPHAGSTSSEKHHTPSAPRQHPPVQIFSPPSHNTPSPLSHMLVAHPAVTQAAAQKSWEAPFDHYTDTYPSYSGTLQDFLTACIYIKLQSRRIRTSLYDDFIRAWVEGYLPYVKECDEAHPPRKALRAIEWYNEIDDDPLFTSRVVTRQNLQSILRFYPNEVEMAERALYMPSSQEPSQHPLPSTQADSISRAPQVPTHTISKAKEPIRHSVEVSSIRDEASTLSPPTPEPRAPVFAVDPRKSTNKPVNDIKGRPIQHTALARSFSESTAHKRIANNELRPEGTKRISLGTTSDTYGRVWSDSGGMASNYSEQSKNTTRGAVAAESTARRESVKAVEDPEERRRRRLAKHFKKRMAGRDSIGSSAPISNTPKSGQERKQ